jgi:hypothetical protein
MKRFIIGLSGLIVLTFIVILFFNGQNSNTGVRKTATEVSKCCSKCPSTTTCAKGGDSKAVACDSTKCKEAKCDMSKSTEGKCGMAKTQEGKSGPSTSKKDCFAKKGETTTSDATSASCGTSCPMKSKEKTK